MIELAVLLAIPASLVAGFALGKVKGRNEIVRRPPPGKDPASERPGIQARRLEYDLAGARPRLEGHVRLILRNFGPGIVRRPPIRFPPPTEDDRMRYVKDAIRMAGRRYGTGSRGVMVRFSEQQGSQQAGSIQVTARASYIQISTAYRELDAALVLIAAHEVAHHALHQNAVSTGDPTEEEELTDTLVVLAGFGPLMLDVYHQEFSGYVEDGIRVWMTGMGYLHPTAIAYLSLLQTEIAGLEPSESLDWGSPWYIDPWEEREEARANSVSRDGAHDHCHVCGEELPPVDPGTNGLTRCKLCQVVQRGPWP